MLSSGMPKKQPDEKLPKKEADKARDATLARMLKTPPKTHTGKPGKSRAPISGKKPRGD